MSNVNILRASIEPIAKMLAGKDIKVEFSAKTTVPVTDFAKKSPVIKLPMLTDKTPPEILKSVQGMVDHEVAHAIWTVSPKKLGIKDKLTHQVANLVEDVRIEREMRNLFRGSAYNLQEFARAVLGDEYLAKLELMRQMKPQAYRLLGLMICLQATEEVPFYQELVKTVPGMQDLYDLITKLWGARPMNPIRSSKDALEFAKDAMARLKIELDEDDGNSHEEGEGDDTEGEEENEESGDSSGDGDSGDSSNSRQKSKSKKSTKKSKGKRSGRDSSVGDSSDPGRDSDACPSHEDSDDGSGQDDKESEKDSSDKDSDKRNGDQNGKSKGEDKFQKDDKKDGEGDGEDDGSGSDGSGSKDDSKDEKDDSPGKDGDGKDESSGKDDGEGGEEGSDDKSNDEGGEEGSEGGKNEDGASEEDSGADGSDRGSEDNGGSTGSVRDGFALKGASELPGRPLKPEDLDELTDMSQKIIEGLIKEARANDTYTVFTTDNDVIEHIQPSTMTSKVEKLNSQVKSMTSAIQKNLERAVAARSIVCWTPGHRRGKLFAPALMRLFTGDERVFRRKEEAMSKDVAVSLVVDCSGSMAMSNKAPLAATAAYALCEVLTRMGIKNEVIGFTTRGYEKHYNDYYEYSEYSRVEEVYMPIFKSYMDKFDMTARLRMVKMFENHWMANNIDGESVQYAAQRLMAQNTKGKIMIVLSDGYPNALGNDEDLCRDLKETVENLSKKIKIVGIGIKSNAVEDYYPKHVVLNDINELPSTVVKELAKLLLTSH